MGGFHPREVSFFIQIEITKGSINLGNITYLRKYPSGIALEGDSLDEKILVGIKEIYPESIMHFWGLIYGDKHEHYKKISLRSSFQKLQIEFMPDIELPNNFSMTDSKTYHNTLFDFNMNVATSHDDKLKLIAPCIKILYNAGENLEELFESIQPN